MGRCEVNGFRPEQMMMIELNMIKKMKTFRMFIKQYKH